MSRVHLASINDAPAIAAVLRDAFVEYEAFDTAGSPPLGTGSISLPSRDEQYGDSAGNPRRRIVPT